MRLPHNADMHVHRSIHISLIGSLLAMWGCTHPSQTAPAPPPQELQPLHAALFDSFLPPECLQTNAALQTQAAALRAQTWTIFSADLAFQNALRSFDHIVQQDRGTHFSDLSPTQRNTLLLAYASSAIPAQRLLTQALRTRYLATIYGSPLGWTLADANPPPTTAPDAPALLAALNQQLPPTRLAYHAESHTISRIGTTADVDVDCLIIGSGPAGAVVAHELSKAGRSVVLVDRGPFVVPGTLNARSMPWLQESAGMRTSIDGGVWFRNGQAVGGGTTINIDLAFSPTLPTVRDRMERWRQNGSIAADLFSPPQIAAAYDWVRQSVGTRTPAENEINANNQILWDGALRMGLHPSLYDLNTFPPGHAPAGVTDKRSAVEGLLLEVLCDTQNPLSLIPEAKVLRILFDPPGHPGAELHASGVELEIQPPIHQPGILHDPARLNIPPGTKVRLSAKTVIVSAGTLGTAALLLNSHINNPLIGTGLVIHPSVPLIGIFDHPIRALEGTPSTVYMGDYAADRGFILEATSATPAYVAAMIPGTGQHVFDTLHNFQNLGGFGVMLIDTPSPENRIILSAAGEPQIAYRLSDPDKARFRAAIAQAIRIMFSGGAQRVILPSNENVFGDDAPGPHDGIIISNAAQADWVERNLQFIPGRTIMTSAHLQASAKMGPAPANSVVSPDFCLWGASNIYVVDSSVFPESVGANPMQSVYTFAKIFADGWLKNHSSR